MQAKMRIPVGHGLLTEPMDDLNEVRLVGTKCRDCGEVTFGTFQSCAACASENVEQIPLSEEGTLWSYTIINHCPPGQYRGAKDPFIPFGEGLVEVPEGVRVVSVLDCDPKKLRIGMKLKFVAYPLYVNDDGAEVIAWKFKAVE